MQGALHASERTFDAERAGWEQDRGELIAEREDGLRYRGQLEADRDQAAQEAANLRLEQMELRQEIEALRQEAETLRQDLVDRPPCPAAEVAAEPPLSPGTGAEVRALEEQLRRQKERAELLQRQMLELQEQLEHDFLVARAQPAGRVEPMLQPPPPEQPPLSPTRQAEVINGNRARLLSVP